jgi:hypothetical protein
MKYLITENKLNKTIRQYVLETFPEVYDVYFKTNNVVLASTESLPTIEETTIYIVMNNINGKMGSYEMGEIARNIVKSVNSFFGLKFDEYASGWDFRVVQLAVVNMNFGDVIKNNL